MRKILVKNNKGGVLKTTLTSNLGFLLSKKHKVLLIDLDYAQINLTRRFDSYGMTEVEKNLFDLVSNDAKPTDVVYELSKNLFIVPGDISLTASTNEKEIVTALRKLFKLAESNGFEYILMDANPGWQAIEIAAAKLTDEVLIPSEVSKDSINGVISLYNLFEEVNMEGKIKSVVLTKVNPRTIMYKTISPQIKEWAKARKINVAGTEVINSSLPASVNTFDQMLITQTKAKKYERQRNIYKQLIKELF